LFIFGEVNIDLRISLESEQTLNLLSVKYEKILVNNSCTLVKIQVKSSSAQCTVSILLSVKIRNLNIQTNHFK